MRASFLLACVSAMIVGACASADGGSSGSGSNDAAAPDDASTDDGGADGGAVDPLTWSYIYRTYFAKGTTPGHCSNSTCHATPHGGFLCSSQSNCYSSITGNNASIGGKLVDPKSPASSLILDPAMSPVVWFDPTNGAMPEDALTANDTAKSEITAWVMAGAPNN